MNLQRNKGIPFKKRILEIIRFCISGGVCFLVDYGTMVLFKECFGFNYLIATGIGFTVSVILNYLMCVFWAFENVNKNNKKAMALFLITSIIGLGLNELFMWFFVDIIVIHYMISKIITAALVMIWNYVTKRKVLNTN